MRARHRNSSSAIAAQHHRHNGRKIAAAVAAAAAEAEAAAAVEATAAATEAASAPPVTAQHYQDQFVFGNLCFAGIAIQRSCSDTQQQQRAKEAVVGIRHILVLVKMNLHDDNSAHPWSPALSQRAQTTRSCVVSLSSSACLAAPGIGLVLPPRRQLYTRHVLPPNQAVRAALACDNKMPGIPRGFLAPGHLS